MLVFIKAFSHICELAQTDDLTNKIRPFAMYMENIIHGKASGTVEVDGDFLVLNGEKIMTSRCRDPKEVGWGALGADYVCESTGVFLTKEKAQAIIDGGAKKVIYSAPAKDDSQTIVMGVNEGEYDGSEDFISCASCTTNGLASASISNTFTHFTPAMYHFTYIVGSILGAR